MFFMSIAPRPQTQPSASSAGERVVRPVTGLGGYDVEVAVDEQARPAGVLALPPHDEAGPAVGRLEDLRLEPHLGEQPRNVLGRHSLPRPAAVAVVGRVDPDQVAADVDDLVLGGRYVRVGALGHGASCGWPVGLARRCWRSDHPAPPASGGGPATSPVC